MGWIPRGCVPYLQPPWGEDGGYVSIDWSLCCDGTSLRPGGALAAALPTAAAASRRSAAIGADDTAGDDDRCDTGPPG